MNVLVFDIETIPDVAGGAKVLGLENLSDADVAEAMFQLNRQQKGTDFLPHHFHRIAAISVVFANSASCKVWSIGDETSEESEIIERFYDGIEKYQPTLVSWNGSGFDLPVLHYRSLVHGISANQYWETGETDQRFKYNNYINRYHNRHLDLMDVLAGYQPRANAPLDQMASLCGFPGKMGMNGAKVWDAFQSGDIKGIRDYCETDVLNTYLVYLRFEKMRGHLEADSYESACLMVKQMLQSSDQNHLQEFLKTWGSHETA